MYATICGMTEMSTSDAAQRLGVSQRQVQRLVASGEVPARRTAGDAWVVDALAVNALARFRPARGRPWSRAVAWGALWTLSGLDVDWLDARTTSRLLVRLDGMTPDALLSACRRRARVARVRVSGSFLAELGDRLVFTGASADAARDFALAPVAGAVDGYCDETTWPSVEERFRLLPDARGSGTIRVTTLPTTVVARREMPRAVVAADLAESHDVRERCAGLRALEHLLSSTARRS